MNDAEAISGDPLPVQAMLEINIIAHLGDLVFARTLPEGLTTAQYGVLNRLVRLRRQESVSELARAFQVSQPTMSSTVAQLRRKGLVAFDPCPDDARRRIVAITPQGERLRAEGVETQVVLAEQLTSMVGSEDWQAILPFLREVRHALEDAVYPPAGARHTPSG